MNNQNSSQVMNRFGDNLQKDAFLIKSKWMLKKLLQIITTSTFNKTDE